MPSPWMARGQRNSGKVLLTLAPPYARRTNLSRQRKEARRVPPRAMPVAQGPVGLTHNLHRIADQLDLFQPLLPAEFQCMDQRQPLGIAVGAAAAILKDMRHPAYHHGDFDGAGIRTAAAVEEDLQALHQPERW